MPVVETHTNGAGETILRSWASELEDNTREQALRTARLPVMAGPVALMADSHLGVGATIGSVVPTAGAIVPSCAGVDLGCGVAAAELDVTETDLPDSLRKMMRSIEAAVPSGVGKGHDQTSQEASHWMTTHPAPTGLSEKQSSAAYRQYGTLGSGNHFIEVCVDERSRVWVMLHSGSRGVGNQLAQGHIKKARTLARELELRLEDPDLAYFMEGTPDFDAYIADMLWAQDYALANRDQMMDLTMTVVLDHIGRGKVTRRINAHHNFSRRETHLGQEMWITRKGAIGARAGEWGVIPGSMGTRSYVVKGLGNPLSYDSCAHGAGRRHSRSAAKRLFTVEELAEQMQGRVWLSEKAEALLDEIPTAYKPIEQVMADQSDLVETVHVLRSVLNVKGT